MNIQNIAGANFKQQSFNVLQEKLNLANVRKNSIYQPFMYIAYGPKNQESFSGCNQFEKLRTDSLLICRPCQVIPNDHLENSWHQFPFADDFFENGGVPSDEQTNIDYGGG